MIYLITICIKKAILPILTLLFLSELLNGQTGINDNIRNDYPLIYNVINKRAKEKYPDNITRQVYVVKEQCDACYYILYPSESIQNLRKDIPTDVWTKIWTNAFAKFSKNEIKYAPCNNVEGNKNKFDCKYSYALVDWVLVKFNIEDQIDSCKKLH